jgi:hypothetical protein
MMANGTNQASCNEAQTGSALLTILQNLVVAINGITNGIIQRT